MKSEGEMISHSPQNSINFGEKTAEILQEGDMVFLIGDLGAGKTVLAKGIARGLGYGGAVTSPSFSIIKIYHGRCPIYHCDFYRLKPTDNLNELGIIDMLDEEGIALLEWGENFPIADITPRWEIKIDFAPSQKEL